MRQFFKWYWEHVKSSLGVGGYVHPLSRECTNFWQAEWRSTKSKFIVLMLPQAVIFALLFLYIGLYLLVQWIST